MRIHPSFTQRAAAALAAIILAASPATNPAIAIEVGTTASEVRGLLRAHYLDAEALSQLPPDADATTLVRRLGDRYSQVLTRQEVAKLLRRYDPAGLNLQVDDASGQLEVGVEPPAGSEAKRAGVRMGDRVVRLGGRGTRGLNIDEVEWLAAEENEATVLPAAGGAERTVRLPHAAAPTSPRRQLTARAVAVRPGAPPVGYLRLGEFTARSGTEAREALRSLKAQGCEQLVLDLRGNGGGAFSGALGVAGLLLEPTSGGGEALVSWSVDQQGVATPHRSQQSQEWSAPLEVWVDWQTASASEIVAGALSDTCRARVVGLGHTFGKGVGQTLYGLSDGGGLALTVSRALSPAGHDLGAGIAPDDARLLLSGVLGDGALAADLLGASFAPVASCDATAALAAPPFALAPWHAKKAGFKAASAPFVALAWASTGGLAAWAGTRTPPRSALGTAKDLLARTSVRSTSSTTTTSSRPNPDSEVDTKEGGS